MESLSGLFGMVVGLAVIILIISIAIYIVQGIFLTKLNKLIYGKGTFLAWIPIANAYLLGKLTINKIVGWVLVIASFSTMTFTTTLNGVEKTTSLLPASISSIVSNIISIAEFGLLIYAIIKYFKLKKENVVPSSQTSQQEGFVPPIEQNNMNVGLTNNDLSNPVQTLNQVNIESVPNEQIVENQVILETPPVVEPMQPVQVESAPIAEQMVSEPIENISVQEVPVVSESVVSAFNQQPTQMQSSPAVEQVVVESIETMNVQETPVVSSFSQQPIQMEQIPVMESVPVEQVEPVATAFNQQPVQLEPAQQSVVSDSIPVETIDMPVANNTTTQSNNN